MTRAAARRSLLFAIPLILLVVATAQAETVVTTNGSVLQGTIEFGIPAVISITSSTGDIFTVQRGNLKSIRFPDEEGGDVTVETFDGNILVGAIGGIPEVIGIQSTSGDVQSVRLASIREIRFDAAQPATTEAPATGSSTPAAVTSVSADPVELAAQLREAYSERTAGLTIGLDSGLQLGVSWKNGFGLLTSTVGINGLTLGLVWRTYFPPSARSIEKAALEIAQDTPGIDLEGLTIATAEEHSPVLSPYIHIGTNTLIIPEFGGGVVIRLSPSIYIDIGGSIDTWLFTWISFGILLVF
jgi:hypothetical protein